MLACLLVGVLLSYGPSLIQINRCFSKVNRPPPTRLREARSKHHQSMEAGNYPATREVALRLSKVVITHVRKKPFDRYASAATSQANSQRSVLTDRLNGTIAGPWGRGGTSNISEDEALWCQSEGVHISQWPSIADGILQRLIIGLPSEGTLLDKPCYLNVSGLVSLV